MIGHCRQLSESFLLAKIVGNGTFSLWTAISQAVQHLGVSHLEVGSTSR